MEFDADQGLLSFCHNGKSQGVAFENIPVDGKVRFCAAISLFKAGASLRVLNRPDGINQSSLNNKSSVHSKKQLGYFNGDIARQSKKSYDGE